MVPDDGNLFLDVPDAPQDRPTSPGPVHDPQTDPQPQPPVPEAGSSQAIAHDLPVSNEDIVCDVSGANPMHGI